MPTVSLTDAEWAAVQHMRMTREQRQQQLEAMRNAMYAKLPHDVRDLIDQRRAAWNAMTEEQRKRVAAARSLLHTARILKNSGVQVSDALNALPTEDKTEVVSQLQISQTQVREGTP